VTRTYTLNHKGLEISSSKYQITLFADIIVRLFS